MDSSSQFAYAANFLSANLSGYSVNASTGALTSLGTFPTGDAPTGVVVVNIAAAGDL